MATHPISWVLRRKYGVEQLTEDDLNALRESYDTLNFDAFYGYCIANNIRGTVETVYEGKRIAELYDEVAIMEDEVITGMAVCTDTYNLTLLLERLKLDDIPADVRTLATKITIA